VFRGGWTAEAAEQVCEEPLALDYLAQLRECSLALAEETEQGMRFSLLETLREFAQAQLSAEERALLQRRHRDDFLRLAEEAKGNLQGPEQIVWLDRLESEHDNLRAALDAWLALRMEEPEGGLDLVLASAGTSE
jgi:non-specific serine/threonine protein kinase